MFPAICIASGPSLTPEDVEFCRDKGRVYVVNDNYKLAPWADALYACDLAWWKHHAGAPEFAGQKYTIDKEAARLYGLTHVRSRWNEAFILGMNAIAQGKNSGFQAMNLAALHGHRRILLLGYDMQRGAGGKRHWFGEHPAPLTQTSDYESWIEAFKKAAPIIKAYGIEVINCSRQTALRCFPQMDLMDALRSMPIENAPCLPPMKP